MSDVLCNALEAIGIKRRNAALARLIFQENLKAVCELLKKLEAIHSFNVYNKTDEVKIYT